MYCSAIRILFLILSKLNMVIIFSQVGCLWQTDTPVRKDAGSLALMQWNLDPSEWTQNPTDNNSRIVPAKVCQLFLNTVSVH